MEPSISVQTIWYFAANEAVSAHFQFIEPFHFVNALLKFAETGDTKITGSVQDITSAQELISERNLLRSFLAERGFETPSTTTKIRRTLRKKMGDGGFPEKKINAIHRSDATKVFFQKAEVLAQKASKQRLTVLPLVTELFDNSAIISKDILTEAGIQTQKLPKTTPVLDSCGKDLSISSPEYGKEKSPEDLIKIKNDPVIKVLVDGLKNHKKEHIVLIQDGTRSGQEIMYMLAYLINQHSEVGITNFKIIEINLKDIAKMDGSKSPQYFKEQVNALLNEATGNKNIILYCSDFEDWLEPKQKYLSLMLNEYLKNGTFFCVCSIKSSDYQKNSDNSPLLKQILRPVWIHNIDTSFNFI
jgi:ATP-dependent Clp protease ATP-binding subunit ClpA